MGRKPTTEGVIEQLRRRGLSSGSAKQYSAEIRRAERWCEAHGWTLRNVPGRALETYLETRPRSWSTRKLCRHALKHYWEIAGRRNPPLWALPLPRKPRMVCRALEPEQAMVLAKAARARGDLHGLAVLLALYAALRREEISLVRWEDFTGDGWLRVLGKGDLPALLPMHPALIHAVGKIPRGASPWVFPGQRYNRPITPTTVWLWVRDVATEAGLGPVPPHVLRHTCLATANDATGDLRAVQELARHARPETTAGYTRVTAERLRRAVASLDY